MTKDEDCVLHLIEEGEDEAPLRWLVKKERGSKGKEKATDFDVKASRTCSTKGSEKKLVADALKVSKSSTTIRRRLKMIIVVEKENVEVVDVKEDENIDPDVVVATEKIRKEIHISGSTRSSL